MSPAFLLYGATGFVGDVIARQAVEYGLQPILAGRNAAKLERQAIELGVEYRVSGLDDPKSLDKILKDVTVVLHCAGPYLYTYEPMVKACLRTGVHYLDLTGEIPVYKALASLDIEAKARGIMLLPGVGFDVVPTDCLALHLKQRLPSATHLTLAFQGVGPADMPPGTQMTAIELIPYGNCVRRDGHLVRPGRTHKTQLIDFGQGPVLATRLTWGDAFTAYYSTGIPNITNYGVFSKERVQLLNMIDNFHPILKFPVMRKLLQRWVKPGPSAEKCAQTITHVWGQVEDDQGRRAVSRLHGPEAGIIWTTRAALAAVKKVLAGNVPSGFQTPALAYGADFVLECEGVTREDLE